MRELGSLWITIIFLFAGNNIISADFWTCNFNNDMCLFKDYAGENQSWIRTNSSTISPGHDHSCMISNRFRPLQKDMPIENHEEFKSELADSNRLKRQIINQNIIFDRKCFWLSTLPVSKFKGQQDFILFSKKQNKMEKDGCLKFSYHFFGLAKASFYVQINSNQSDFGATNVFAKFVPQSNRWADAQVHVPKQDAEFYFIFKAHLDAKYQDNLGLDDISFSSSSSCTPTGNIDFESGNQGVWVADGMMISTGELKDHTTGTYAGHFASSTAKQPSTLSADIKNLTQRFTSDEYSNCLKFFYQFVARKDDDDTQSYIDLNTTGVLFSDKRVKVESIINDGLQNAWQLMTVNIPSYKRAKDKDYTLKISLSTSKNTRIGIDDLIVLDRACPSSGDCDFESDWCGWTESSFSGGIWLRSDGMNSASFKESPKVDHTTLTEKGFFLMIPNEFMTQSSHVTLKSPPLGNTGSINRCFQFAYFAHTKKLNDSVLKVTVKDLTKSGREVVSKIVNGTTYAFWSNFSIHFPSKMPKAYVIEITPKYLQNSLLSDLAIDDLALRYSCDNSPSDNPYTTTPIPFSERKWDCKFEFPCSGWTFDKNWKRTSFSKIPADSLGNSQPPRLDHTYNSHTGGYLLYMPKIDDSINGTTQVLSILNSTNITGKSHCLDFYYYDASESLVQLDILTIKSYGTFVQKSIRPNSASKSWIRVRVDLQFISADFRLSMVLHAAKTVNGSFAIDDILIRPGECQHMEDYTYTMDALENMDVNLIQPLKGGIGKIVDPRLSLFKQNYPNAPKYDHTTGTGSGYFLFMNKKGDYNTTYKTELVIDNLEKAPLSKAIKGKCIKFAYQIVGNAQLEVYVDAVDSDYHNYPIFRTAANHSKWTISQTTFAAFYKHKITFVMEKKFDSGLTSYIAIDDVSFSNNCDSPVQCNFDDDLCSYTSDYNSYSYSANYAFARFVGPPLNRLYPGPGYDHTVGSYGGGYLALTGFPLTIKKKRTAQIETPIMILGYEKTTNSCFSFFTFLTGPDAEVVVTIRLFAREGDSTDVKLMKLSGITETRWERHYVDIDGGLFKGKNEFIFVIEGSTTESVVSIDDVLYSSFDCAYKHEFKCKNGNSISVDKVCNFRDDCGDNTDEKECGTCDFETDTCNWTNGTDYGNSKVGGQWVQVQAGNVTNGPDHDGKMNKSGHYLLVEKSKFSDKNYPIISDTTLTRYYDNYQYQFKDAYFSCYMTFETYITSNFPKTRANIQVWAGSDKDSAVIKLEVPVDPTTQEWALNAAFIGSFSHSFIVQFRASEMSINETIAIDNIAFNKCAFPDPIKGDVCPNSEQILCNSTRICISPDDLCDFENNCGDNFDESYSLCSPFKSLDVPVTCAFEQSLDTCGMTLDNLTKANNIYWQMMHGSTMNFRLKNMPSADHSTKDKHGQFMTLYAPTYGLKKKNFGKPVLLYSPFMTSDSSPCTVRFFYYNNGQYNADKNNFFRVYGQYADGSEGETDTLFHSDSYLATWNKASAKIESKKPFRFVFSGTINDPKGSISVDSISYATACYSSDAVFKPGTPHHGGSSAFLVILLIVLALAIVSGAFFAFRKHQAGELSFDSIQSRVRSLIPGSKNANSSFDNPHHFSK